MWNLFLTAGYEFHCSEINKANNPLKGNNMFNERFLSSALFFLSASPFSQPPELFIMLAALCYSPSYYISVLADQILLGLAVFLNLYFRFEPSQKKLLLFQERFHYSNIWVHDSNCKQMLDISRENDMFLSLDARQSAFGLSFFRQSALSSCILKNEHALRTDGILNFSRPAV